ncbi:MAG: pyridoxine 5'-phosphate synthase [Ignavibacteriales bacterium]|nr:pyridoxine 5'-phosphate synthase [Ignavibacteriales bacterium]
MRLCINLDHIATLRNARGGELPDPSDAATVCEQAGVDGIVCHLREDRRHIRDNDLKKLRKIITTKLDLEMSIAPDIVKTALMIKPEMVTLVPEKRLELTTEGGLDVIKQKAVLKKVINKFRDNGILVSLFINPAQDQIDAAKDVGANMIEIHTGEYAEAIAAREKRKHLVIISQMSRLARKLELGVNAGHGLNYTNIQAIVKIREIEEVSIGYAVIVRALSVGLETAVREMVALVKGK